jgi:hypothetical protein
MADYSDAYRTDFEWTNEHKAQPQPRRITQNQGFTAGGIVPNPIPAPTTVGYRAVFGSKGDVFTVAELRAVLNKLGATPNATITFEKVVTDEGTHGSTNTQAVVEWEA